MKVTLRAISTIRPYETNPRTIGENSISAVSASIREFGFRQPIVVDSDGVIIAGHTRYFAAQKLGLEKVPVHVATDLTPEQIRAYRIADNKTGELAEWNLDLLTAEITGLQGAGFDLDSLGFDSDELTKLLGGGTVGLTDPDEVPEPPKIPVCKPGDLWILGEHRLLCGDSAKAEDVARLMNNQKINVAFTSPPYADRREYDKTSGFKPISPDEYVEWFNPIAANVKTNLAVDGSWFVNIKPSANGLDSELYVFDLVIAHARHWGWHFATEFCWERNGIPKSVTRRFKNQFEPIYQFSIGEWKMRADAVRHPSASVPKARGKGAGNTSWAKHQGHESINMSGHQGEPGFEWFGDNVEAGLAYPGNRLPSFTGSHEALGHAAAFPVGLPAFFIKAYTDLGNNIYEPFCGSGSTLVAAEQLGRKCYGMEISPQYCDVICTRWENFTGRKVQLSKPASKKAKAKR